MLKPCSTSDGRALAGGVVAKTGDRPVEAWFQNLGGYAGVRDRMRLSLRYYRANAPRRADTP